MRLAAVLPGDSARGNAGVRIRYDRLRPRLEALGHRLDFVTIDRFRDENTPLDADLYVFLKIYDARSLVLARRMRAEGRRVGIDLFDDYFSPSPDPRLVHLRRWFRDMRPALDLVLRGTPALAAPSSMCRVPSTLTRWNRASGPQSDGIAARWNT